MASTGQMRTQGGLAQLDAQRHVVFGLAGGATRMTANALALVDQKSVVH